MRGVLGALAGACARAIGTYTLTTPSREKMGAIALGGRAQAPPSAQPPLIRMGSYRNPPPLALVGTVYSPRPEGGCFLGKGTRLLICSGMGGASSSL